MKKLFLIALLTISIPSFAYTEDTTLQNCMKEQNYTTAGMIDCSYNRASEFNKLSKNLVTEIQKTININNYNNIKQNQLLLDSYKSALKNGEINILYSTQGTIYPLFASGIILDIAEVNYQILEIISTGKKTQRDIASYKIPMNKMNKEIDKELKRIKKDFPKEDYDKIIQSQKAWENYKNDISTNILPMFKPELQDYIKRIVWESRIGILSTVNIIYEYKH